MPLIDKLPRWMEERERDLMNEKHRLMNKEVILKSDQEVERIKFEDVKTSDIIGFIDGSGHKGYFVYIQEKEVTFLYAVKVHTELLTKEYSLVPKSIDGVPFSRMIVFERVTGPDGLYAWLSKQE